jgi:protein-disulfide isomerase
MLKKLVILILTLILIQSCNTTNNGVKKDSNKNMEQLSKTVYRNYYNDTMKLYSIEDKIVTLKDLKNKYPQYAESITQPVEVKKADFLRQEVLKYIKENNISDYKILLPTEKKEIDLTNEKQTKGLKDAPYTLVVFSDFQCPYCSKYANEFDEKIAENKDFKVVFKHFPLSFHKNATEAAIASICASNQNKFWEFHHEVFKNQDKLSDDLYLTIARELKLDENKFMECLTSEETKKALQKDIEEGNKLGVRGTPTYFLNGIPYKETRDIAEFNKIYKNYEITNKDIKYSDLDKENVVFLYLNKKAYTFKDFYKIKPNLSKEFYNKNNNEAYNNLKQVVESDIVNVLFTKEAKLNKFEKPEEYVNQLVKTEVKEPSNEEVQVLYDAYKSRLRGATFDQVKNQLKEFIMKSKVEGFFKKKNLELIEKYKVLPLLLPPKFFIKMDNRPVLGNKDAKNTIFIFSDFQCPYCSRISSIIEKLSEEKNIKIVFKFFPLKFHTRALPTAIASFCAYKQNKFWEFHNKAFENQNELNEENFLTWAKELKLDLEKFKECATNKETAKEIKKDLDEGVSIGVQGTPSLYINGMLYEDDPSNIDKINQFIQKIK